MFNKFSDLVRWIVEWSKSTLPGIKADIDNASTTAAVNAARAAESANSAAESVSKALTIIEEAQKVVVTPATDITYGVVKTATEDDIELGSVEKVAKASQVKDLRALIISRTPLASTTEAGLAKFCVPSDIVNFTPNVIMSPDMLRYFQVRPDMSEVVQFGQTAGGYTFSRLQSGNDAMLEVVGRIEGPNETIIVFPMTVDPLKMGVAGSVINAPTKHVGLVSIATGQVKLGIFEGSNLASGSAVFIIRAVIDTTILPPPPVKLAAFANGDTVTLSWEE